MIKRLTERVSPRVFRVVALPAPSDRQKTQIYMQRYIEQLPAAGEIVIFDRSWYNRPGVERVMGYCTEEAAKRFLQEIPHLEALLAESGITLLKYFLTVGEEEQERRFRQRIDDPVRQWKLRPMDLESYRRWWDYTAAYDEMIRMTDTPHAPWWIVDSNDKKAARINCITHLLASIPYEKVKYEEPKLGKRQKRPDDYAADRDRAQRGAGGVLSIRVDQGRASDHFRSSRSRAFAMTTSLRMTAVMASFAGFPARISWSYFAFRSGLKRVATSAGM